MPADPKVNVGVAVVLWDGDNSLVVITRAGKDAEAQGKLSVPGGWIDHGETPVEAAIREAREETGVVAAPFEDEDGDEYDGPILGVTHHISEKNGNSCITIWVLLNPIGAPEEFTEWPEPDKVSDIRWMDIDDLKREDHDSLFAPVRLAIEQEII